MVEAMEREAAASQAPDGARRAPDGARPRTRRAPDPEARLRDAERTRQRILDAALSEFSEKGFAGARVRGIAERAGVNAQLISYYFGGKEGVYAEIMRRWHETEAAGMDRQDLSYAELAGAMLVQPELLRILIWDGLTRTSPAVDPRTAPGEEPPEIADMRRRQANGEFPADVEPGYLLIALQGILAAPVTMPQQVELLCGISPESPEFAAKFGEQMRRLLAHLRVPDATGGATG